MLTSRVMLVGGLLLGLALGFGCSGVTTKTETSEEKAKEKTASNQDKLVGSWELVKSERGAVVAGNVTLTFARDGQFTFEVKNKGTTQEGTYAVEGDKLKTTTPKDDVDDKKVKVIKKLTDTVLVLADEKGKKDEYKKVGSAAASPREKLVGTWEQRVDEGGGYQWILAEFARDGKLQVKLSGRSKEGTFNSVVMNGTYAVEGDKLKQTVDEKAKTATIKSLTDSKLVIEDDAGKTLEFTRRGGGPTASEKILGRWEAVKITGTWHIVPGGAVAKINRLVFNPEGKKGRCDVGFEDRDGDGILSSEEAYAVEGNQLKLTRSALKGGNVTETWAIQTLTENRLVLAAKGKTDEFKRVRE